MTFRRLVSPLNPADVVTIVFLVFLTLLNLLFASRVAEWLVLVCLNCSGVAAILWLAQRAGTRASTALSQLHRWYLYVTVFLLFKELYVMVRPIHPVDYDTTLIAIDHWLFGVNPTEWLSRLAHPFLTELLQIGYSSYYLLFVIVGVDVFRTHSWKEFDTTVFFVVYGFYLSFLGYFLIPAVGPRFTVHSFDLLSKELPGMILTEPLRAFVNWGESIPRHAENAMDLVQRDVFPSGHTQLSLVLVYCAFHFKTPLRWLASVLAILLIIGTVYLRYHYVIDVVGGAIFFVFTVWSGWSIVRWWENFRRDMIT
jgi:membrane-associated phospholipid phosphatase